MSSQAVAGMTAGLLTQPRYRKSSYLASTEVTELRQRVKDLELKVSTQQKLIEILKSLPGQKENVQVEVKDGKPTRKSGVQRGSKTKDRAKSNSGPAREPKDDGSGFRCDDQDAEVVAEESADATVPA